MMPAARGVSFVAFTVALALLGSASAQVIGFGNCPEVTLQSGFDASQYLGDWFEIMTYPNFFEAGSKCAHAEYSTMSGGVIKVNNTATKIKSDQYTEVVGSAYAPDPVNEPAKLLVNFPSSGPFWAPYWVIATDYVNYSVVYTCSKTLGVKTEFAWILSRTVTVSDSIKLMIAAVLEQNKINPTKFKVTEHSGCKNY